MSAATPSPRVLLADDDRLLRDIAASVLGAAGFIVETAASGDAAVSQCADAMPDIVLLDVDMPGGDGYQACAGIRCLPAGLDIPIVMVTGLDDPTSIDLAYRSGATDFVVKPINWTLLIHRIRYVLRAARTIEALRISEQKNSALLAAIPDGILLVNAAGSISHWFSAPPVGTAARQLGDLVPHAALAPAMQCLDAALRGSPATFEFTLGEGRPRHFECRCMPHAAGQVLVIVRDITERKQTEARIHRLAYHDPLTGLPNRAWIGEHLERALAEAAERNRGLALMFVDLDQFKRINDTLGHATGDALVQQVGQRLQRALEGTEADGRVARGRGCLARVGGDEFVIVISGQISCADAEYVAQRIQAAITRPFEHGGHQLVVTPSIGIALYPEHGADAQTLLKNADAAMYEAKASGRNQYQFFNSAVLARAQQRLSLEMELRRAFEREQLEIYYQPQYEAASLRLSGGEALVRWVHPEQGQIPGREFAAVAEDAGLAAEIGRWTLRQVCGDIRRWRDAGLIVPAIAVNVSGREILRADALLRISAAVEDAQVPASLLELELTEGVLMRAVEGGERSLRALKALGFALAVDDFGTGFCSLSYLRRFPLDTLRIDSSVVRNAAHDPEDAALVRAIIGLGHNLNLKLVAGGVRTPEQLEFLRREGCDLVQGFNRPVPAATFADLLRAPHSAELPRPAVLVKARS
ncbi:MAG TPA: EAL domain-containing protein [Steroidobacteraceae bacterium]|nr:EAL domain-containing protein [Steroidobacteraceae bacterium]